VLKLFSYCIFDFTPNQIEPLHWRTFVLKIGRIGNPWILAAVFITAPIFYVRGSNYRDIVWGDDKEFLDHALSRNAPIGRLHAIDPLGLLDPFAGYAAFLLRLITQLVRLGGVHHYANHTFYLMSIIWTLFALWIAFIMTRVSGPIVGFLSALIIAVMPFSNLVMLAQLNTLAWPSVLILCLTILSREYPRSKIGQVLMVLYFSALALTTISVFLAFGYLVWIVKWEKQSIQKIERVLMRSILGALVIQAISFTPRGQSLSPVKLFSEFIRSANAFAPQFLREQVLEQKSIMENLALYGIPILLFAATYALFRISSTGPLRHNTKIAVKLLITALAMLCALIAGNGWLNSHYLFIPTGLFWIAALVLVQATLASRNKYKMIPVVVVVAIYLSSLSGTYFVI